MRERRGREEAVRARGFVVYALVDPRDGLPHYVGRTSDLKRRIRQHWSQKGAGRGLGLWLHSVRAAGVRVEAKVLEQAETRDESKTAEARWIRDGAAQGWPLANNHLSPVQPPAPPLPPGKTFAVIAGHFVGCLACTLIGGKRACPEHRPSHRQEVGR